jgi:hypothetical protein
MVQAVGWAGKVLLLQLTLLTIFHFNLQLETKERDFRPKQITIALARSHRQAVHAARVNRSPCRYRFHHPAIRHRPVHPKAIWMLTILRRMKRRQKI